MTALRYELRRGIGLSVLPLLVLLHSIVIYRILWPHVSVWLNVTSAVVSGTLLSGPLATAMAAWVAMRERRRGTSYLRLTSARGEAAAPMVELAACVIVALMAYALAFAGAAVITLPNATSGGPDWAWLGVGAMGLVLLTVVGYTAGRLVPKVWVPPVLAVACYVFAAWSLTKAGRSWAYLSPVTQQEPSLFRDVNAALLGGEALWFLGIMGFLVGVVVVVSGGGSGQVRVVPPVVASVVLAAAGMVVVLSQDGRFFDSPHGVRYRCSTTSPVVCVHPAFAKGLPRLSERFSGMWARLDGTPAAVTRVEQLERGLGEPSSGAGSFALDGVSDADLRQALADYLNWVPIGAMACATPGARESGAEDNVQMVRSWLLDDASQFFPQAAEQVAALDWFAGITEEERRAWFKENYDAIASCSLTTSALNLRGR